MKFITTKSFMPFVIYRIALGIPLFVLVGADVLSPRAGESAGWRDDVEGPARL